MGRVLRARVTPFARPGLERPMVAAPVADNMDRVWTSILEEGRGEDASLAAAMGCEARTNASATRGRESVEQLDEPDKARLWHHGVGASQVIHVFYRRSRQ